MTNTGTLAASFKLDVVGCSSGSAFPSPSTCVITSPAGGLTGTLAQNASSAVTVSFNTVNAGTSGTITLRARHVVDSTGVFDTGFSNINVVAAPRGVMVTALSPTRTDTRLTR